MMYEKTAWVVFPRFTPTGLLHYSNCNQYSNNTSLTRWHSICRYHDRLSCHSCQRRYKQRSNGCHSKYTHVVAGKTFASGPSNSLSTVNDILRVRFHRNNNNVNNNNNYYYYITGIHVHASCYYSTNSDNSVITIHEQENLSYRRRVIRWYGQ